MHSHPVHTQVVQRDSISLHYGKSGKGPLVVLIPGLGMAAATWLNLPAALARRGVCVLTPDNRGMGWSHACPSTEDISVLADDLATIVRAETREPAIVVGASLGGMIAQQLALRHPALVRGLMLVSTSCGLPVGRPSSAKILTSLANALCNDSIDDASLIALLTHSATGNARIAAFSRWTQELNKWRPTRETVLTQLKAAASHNVGHQLGQIDCPAEILAGEADRIIPAENSNILATLLPKAQLTMLPNTGHAIALENPRAFSDTLLRLLKRCG